MQELNENIIELQESESVPALAWKVEIVMPDSTVHNITERFKSSNPGIIDSADYRENLTYVNEVNLILNNEDGFLTNVNKTGILDVEDGVLLEIKISGYFNVSSGNNYPLKKFGGWIDLKRVKPSETKKQCSVTAYSYFGLGDYVKASNITNQYIDSIGLILWKTGLWVKDAGIVNYILKNGIHSIETRTESGTPQARLDDGDWVNLSTQNHDFTLKNHFDTERVLIHYDSLYTFNENQTSNLIVKSEGEKYPETFYYYPDINIIIKKAFEYLHINDTFVDRYDIQTYDGRRVPSLLKYAISSMTNSSVSIVSDGESRMFISLISDSDTPTPKNQIWYYNYSTDTLTKIYETTENTYTKHRLILDTVVNKLIAFYDNKTEDEDRCQIQVFDLSVLPTIQYSSILSDTSLENANAYIRFHYLYATHTILIVKSDGIYALDLNGSISKVIDESNIETYGFSCMWEKPGGNWYLYFTKNVGGVKKIYRAQYAGYWLAAEYVKDFHNQSDYNEYYAFTFYTEDKIITMHNFSSVRYFKITDNTEGAIDIGSYNINSLIEYESKMYYFAQTADGLDRRVGHISNNASELDTDNLNDNTFFKISSTWMVNYQVQKICMFKNINNEYDLAFISNRPAFLFRFSKYITPYIYDEYDYASKTIRDLLQDIANNYLGFVKISSQKKGYYVNRDIYESNDIITIKKKFIKARGVERVYNEVYDAIIVKTQGVEAFMGNRAINSKVLSLNLGLVPDEIAYDMAQYFLDYYSIKRKIETISYIPTFYNYDSLDKVNLDELGLPAGKIHKLAPKKESLEIAVLYKEVSE